MLLGALRSALSAKVRDGELKVVQDFNFADNKTKNAMNVLATLEAGRTVLVVDNEDNRNLELGLRNLKGPGSRSIIPPARAVTPAHNGWPLASSFCSTTWSSVVQATTMLPSLVAAIFGAA